MQQDSPQVASMLTIEPSANNRDTQGPSRARRLPYGQPPAGDVLGFLFLSRIRPSPVVVITKTT